MKPESRVGLRLSAMTSHTSGAGDGQIRQASLSRRLFALAMDWLASSLVARLLTENQTDRGWVTLVIFFIEVSLFTTLLGGSAGQVIAGIRIVDSESGRKIAPLAALIRTGLICLVVPALLTVNGRGLHDRAVKSVAVVNA